VLIWQEVIGINIPVSLTLDNRKDRRVDAILSAIFGASIVIFFGILSRDISVVLVATIVSSIAAGCGYLFVLYVERKETKIYKVTLTSERIIIDTDELHREPKYSELEKAYYKDGIVTKALYILSPKIMWTIRGIPVEGEKHLNEFIKLANKKIAEAKSKK